jgi:hypothetical protein
MSKPSKIKNIINIVRFSKYLILFIMSPLIKKKNYYNFYIEKTRNFDNTE